MTSVIVTGGTGTFGKAVIDRLLCDSDIDKIAVYSRDEQKQEAMAREFKDPRIRFFIGDVRDEERLRLAFKGVDLVIHAAAMKIVPACEFDPIEAIKTNILGSVHVINAAVDSPSIKKVIALSTDKAVSATNLYGGTKFVAEKAFVAANNLATKGGAAFSVVRYGNVSGSRGSVIPKWRLFAASGQPLPITDLNMTRFWISIGDAAEFVLNGVKAMLGGEVFVPKMPSFRVCDLGIAICGGQCDWNVIGIRPGEKLHEDIITVHEGRMTTENEYAYAICPPWMPPETPMEDGFSLSSERNDLWLSVDDLRTLLDAMD